MAANIKLPGRSRRLLRMLLPLLRRHAAAAAMFSGNSRWPTKSAKLSRGFKVFLVLRYSCSWVIHFVEETHI